MKPRILVVDDEPQILRALNAGLRANSYEPVLAADGEEALTRAATDPPNVIVLDLQMPGTDGLEVIRQIREWSTVPIIVLSAHAEERDKVQALDTGADDYLTKPFGMEELLARIRVALRRANRAASGDPVLDFGRLRIDLAARVVTLDGEEVHLTPTEYELLRELATNAGKVMTHQMLLTRVWGPASEGSTNYLRVYINQLRHKLEPDAARPRYILTDPGVGYRFRPAGDDGARS
ncbi:MAG TPA: response regulator transcription factor [Thermomicrobiales bacterium]|nr:response regulator transcription factor [Thermomicrobiales bacterium]